MWEKVKDLEWAQWGIFVIITMLNHVYMKACRISVSRWLMTAVATVVVVAAAAVVYAIVVFVAFDMILMVKINS